MLDEKKVAVLLVNLGTPEQATAASVRAFLGEFLSDQRVIEGKGLRRWLWLFILNVIILRIRPKRVAKLYQEIWQEDSPMRLILKKQEQALQQRLNESLVNPPTVFHAMTYGKPSLTARLKQLSEQNYSHVIVIPLFPQYSATSTAPVYDKVADFQKNSRDVLDIRIVKNYYDHPAYIEALAVSVESHREERESVDTLLLSYHGIPQQYADAGDPYDKQCKATTSALVERLKQGPFNWDHCNFMTTFQSRFGPTQWITPYTDERLEQLGKEGTKNIDVICPAFSADCLETLEEMAQTNKEVFLSAGGGEYNYIAALNDNAPFIECLVQLVNEQARDWLGDSLET